MGTSRHIRGKPAATRPPPATAGQRGRTANIHSASISLEQIPSGALLLDATGRIADANARAAKLFRCKRRQLRGHAAAEWIADWESLARSTPPSVHRRIEAVALRADGSRASLLIAPRNVTAEGAAYTLLFIADRERRRKLELEVRDANYTYHQLARVMPYMLWTCSPDGAATYISPKWIKFTGQPLEAHLGYGWLDYLHPDDRLNVLQRWHYAVERNETFKTEFRVRRADGEYRWFDSTSVLVRDRAGNAVRWMGSNVDIHDAREMRQTLIRERDRFSNIAATVPGAIFAYRMHPDGSATFEFASAGIKDLYGISPEQLARDAAEGTQLVHPEDAARVRKSVLESAQTLTPWHCEWRVRHPQKGEIWIESRSVPTRDPDGSTLWYGLMMDITERKHAEEELRRSRARLEATVMASGIGTWILDVEKHKLWFDETLRKMLDTVESEFDYAGIESLRRFGNPADWPLVAPAITAMREGKTDTYSIEYRNLRADGATQWLAVNARAERDATGKIIRVTGACTDITARKAAEESQRQSQRVEALGTLAGGIAHDFNNILLAITGNARLALAELPQATPADAQLRRSLLEIDKASARATDLVRNILAFSRQSELRRETIQLRTPIEEAVKLLRASLPAMIAIETSFAADTPAVLADSTQIYQVIMNLVTNSAYAIGDGLGKITVTLDAEQIAAAGATPDALKPGLYARVTVTDSGAGMDRKTLEKIFDPFFSTKPAGQGTGLGLSVVHGIMRSHQGTTTVSSEPGHGATFRLYFPAVAATIAPTPKAQREPSQGKGRRVLYVDDEEALVYLITRILDRLGYNVTGFTDAEKALETFRQNPTRFDVVVTDLSMPTMSGFHFARQLLKMRPDIPLLMTSGYVSTQDRDMAQQLGIHELILKPNTIEELGHSLARLFEEQQRRKDSSAPDSSVPA